ncbi:MAG: hypothetical protein EBZ77_05225 [Chitinophagia bacterium]|nr:hypothetical protein [Chitinophagia bacterium]
MWKNIALIVLLLVACGLAYRYRSAYDALVAENAKPKKFVEHELKYKVGTTDSSLKGYILTSVGATDRTAGGLLIFSADGRLVYRKDLPAAAWDFRQWKLGDKVYYTYAVTDSASYHKPEVASFAIGGHYLLLDSAMNEISQIHLLPHEGISRNNKADLDVHDFILLSEKHYIAYTGYEKEVNNIPAELQPAKNKKVIALVIQEVDNGKVIWQWDATQFPEFYKSSLEDNDFKNDTPCDYIHNNTITLDGRDSNLIVSMRNLNQIVKINRKSGQVMWRLGGKNSDFPLEAYHNLYGQHAVKFMNDGQTLQIFDNGHKDKRPYSRIVEVRLDEQNHKVTYFKQYPIPHSFSSQRGNVTTVGDKYLICGGLGNYLLMVDPQTNKYLFEVKTNMPMYRAYFAESIAGLHLSK